MQEAKLWRFILDRLNHEKPVVLLCVLESKGSSPGRQGFKMAVANDEIIGSIGGGIMEHKFVELAKEKLKENNSSPIIKKQFHNKAVKQNQSGMICSGEQTIFLYQIKSGDKNAIEKIISALQQNKNGELKITNNKITFSESAIPVKDFHFEMNTEDDFKYIEKTGYKNHLYIIGGGHCALALSELMNKMDFYISLFEERKSLNTFLRNDFVHEKKIVNDYSELKDKILVGTNDYTVIMTFGYRTDAAVLHALENKDFKYIGVLGSKSKVEKMFSELSEEGLSDKQLKKIHAPIGLDIKSETPEEIAVSIAAEIIKVKNSYVAPAERIV